MKRGTWRRRAAGIVVGAALLAGLSGCSEVSYLAQAAAGQADLILRARPVADALTDPAVSAETRRKLALVRDVRAFAVAPAGQGGLGLPDHGSFLKFVDVGRPYVVWNVFSAPEFSVRLDTQCFPVAGCVAYRGYFNETAARAEGRARAAAGKDVLVGGVSAYSTLGYLKDPVLSTMLAYPDATLIRTVIHELAHPAVYVKDDTVFNESYATAVEEEGMRRWLEQRGTPELREQDRRAQDRAQDFNALLLSTRGELEALYTQAIPPKEMRRRKADILADLNARYAALKAERWGGYAGYDGWFARGVNNAALGSVAAYAALVPDFQVVMERVGGNVPAFIRAVQACAGRPAAERAPCLREAGQPGA